MALQRVILVPPELWENLWQESPSPPVKKILICKYHSYKNWTKFRLHQDTYLKVEKQKREPIPIPIIESGSTKPGFKTKPIWKRVIGSVPLFKKASESETDSNYIHNVLSRKYPMTPLLVCSKMIITALLKQGSQVLNMTINTCL